MKLDGEHGFVLQWNPEEFNWEDGKMFDRAVDSTRRGKVVKDRWTTGNRKQGIRSGDRIFLRLTGTRGRGLIASGRATGEIMTDRSDPNIPYRNDSFVELIWDTVLALDEILPIRDLAFDAPSTVWGSRGGGIKLERGDLLQVESAWQAHLSRSGRQNHNNLPQDAILRSYKIVEARKRGHQDKFKKLLLANYPHECFVCGLNRVEILEAAHLVPDSEGGEPTIKNGRLLCPNHHRAHNAKPPTT